MRFTILGPVGARRGDVEVDLGGRQQRLVLALLLVRHGSVVTLAELVDTLWGQDPPTSAANVIHRHIGLLRRIIEPDLPVRAVGAYLVRQAAGYQLRVDEDGVDLLRFRRLAAEARRADEPGHAVARYAEALALWRGSCAAGLAPDLRRQPAFAAIDAERAQVVRDAADVALLTDDVRRVIPALRQAIDRDPLDEALRARLVLALAADGRQAEALASFQEIRQRLSVELGMDPSHELSEAYQRVLHQRFRAATIHRGGHPSAGGKEEIRSVEPPCTPAQLPPGHPFFSGRADVLARAELLLDEDRRQGRATVALAIDGMPGIGKTTFAIQLGHRLASRYPDGQLYADLRGCSAEGAAMSPGEALRGFLSSLGVPEGAMPTDLHALAGRYRSILAGRRILIVLDNCRDFEQVRHLLPGAPGCLAIVTSRQRSIGLISTAGAHPLPLTLPSADEAREHLVRCLGSARVAADPTAVEEIIIRSGRLPLAVAKVAARAAARPDLPLAAIAALAAVDHRRVGEAVAEPAGRKRAHGRSGGAELHDQLRAYTAGRGYETDHHEAAPRPTRLRAPRRDTVAVRERRPAHPGSAPHPSRERR
ncbi:AfsR/SARP family transcriptional regulator [Micromonospora endophytica]|uniref:AfsR/SARP family transcriptional regulator n=1 Tax=Micromonospora endophytica TaxID=515350 RepID=UPI0015E88F2B|nr:BTAD domain-containing putative transcriptional regulator [Micromonospora endophytica]